MVKGPIDKASQPAERQTRSSDNTSVSPTSGLPGPQDKDRFEAESPSKKWTSTKVTGPSYHLGGDPGALMQQLLRDKPDHVAIQDLAERLKGKKIQCRKVPLFEWGFKPETGSPEQMLMQHVVERSDLRSAKLLLENKAVDVNDIDNSGLSALHYAIRRANPEMVQLLLEHGAKPNLRSLLIQRATPGVDQVLNYKRKATELNTPLHELAMINADDPAVQERTVQIAKMLLDKKADKNATSATPVASFAAVDGGNALHLTAYSNNGFLAEYLVSQGVDKKANAGSKREPHATPLEIATYLRNHATMEVLLKGEGPLESTGRAQKPTALQLAAQNGDEQALQMLIPHYSSVDTPRSEDGRTALHVAVDNKKSGAVSALLKAGADFTLVDGNSQNVFHRAAMLNDATLFQLLMDQQDKHRVSAALSQRDKYGLTPLEHASRSGNQEVAKQVSDLRNVAVINEQFVKLALRHGHLSGERPSKARDAELDSVDRELNQLRQIRLASAEKMASRLEQTDAFSASADAEEAETLQRRLDALKVPDASLEGAANEDADLEARLLALKLPSVPSGDVSQNQGTPARVALKLKG